MLEPVNVIYFLIVLFILYVFGVVIFLILDNRSPQATIAWILVLTIFPVLGVLLYRFFGQGWKAFSKEYDLARQELGGVLTPILGPLAARQVELIDRIEREGRAAYKRKLLELVRYNSSSMLTAGNEAEILQDAREKYPRLLADVEQARHSIHMEYFIWQVDEFTDKVKELLIQKAREGVEVRILYDAVGSFPTFPLHRRYLHELREGGVEICAYLDFLSPLTIHTVSYRNHRKIAVIDGKIGYLGGMNMGQEQIDGGKHFDSWRDTHLRVVGEAALVLQAIFVTSWFNTTREKLDDECYFPPAETAGHFLPIQIITAGPDSQWAAIRQLYFLMVMAAEKHVYIQSPFFIPDESIAEALKAAALSGVEIKMMFAPRGTTYRTPYWAANTYFADMARAGIRIFLYQKGYFHPKTISIDANVCSIGSANMDIRSFSLDYEANAVIYDSQVAKELEADFRRDLEQCTEFSLEEYESRNVLLRFRDSLSRLLSPLL
jgi:cardiolipin synthase